jgi:hypothetical protein
MLTPQIGGHHGKSRSASFERVARATLSKLPIKQQLTKDPYKNNLSFLFSRARGEAARSRKQETQVIFGILELDRIFTLPNAKIIAESA